jgi:hypothetical protein
MHLDAPEDQEPAGTSQPLMVLGEPSMGTDSSSLCHRILPGVLPLPIAHRIAALANPDQICIRELTLIG